MNNNYCIIDGNNNLYRSLYVNLKFYTKDGIYTGALFNFLKILNTFRIFGKLIVVFDGQNSSSYRRKFYPEYKANRLKDFSTMSEEDKLTESKKQLSIQQSLEILPILGIPTISFSGIEADDIIYHLALHLKKKDKNNKVTVASGDRDYFQLLQHDIGVYQPIKDEYINADNFERIYEFSPEYYVLYRSLEGDGSDNIPGIDGIGSKKSANIMKELKSPDVDSLLAWAADGKKLKIKDNILNGVDIINRNMILMDLSKSGLDAEKIINKCNNIIQNSTKDYNKAKELFEKYEFTALYEYLVR